MGDGVDVEDTAVSVGPAVVVTMILTTVTGGVTGEAMGVIDAWPQAASSDASIQNNNHLFREIIAMSHF